MHNSYHCLKRQFISFVIYMYIYILIWLDTCDIGQKSMFSEIAFCVQEEEMLKRYIVHKKVIFALWKFCKVIKPF